MVDGTSGKPEYPSAFTEGYRRSGLATSDVGRVTPTTSGRRGEPPSARRLRPRDATWGPAAHQSPPADHQATQKRTRTTRARVLCRRRAPCHGLSLRPPRGSTRRDVRASGVSGRPTMSSVTSLRAPGSGPQHIAVGTAETDRLHPPDVFRRHGRLHCLVRERRSAAASC